MNRIIDPRECLINRTCNDLGEVSQAQPEVALGGSALLVGRRSVPAHGYGEVLLYPMVIPTNDAGLLLVLSACVFLALGRPPLIACCSPRQLLFAGPRSAHSPTRACQEDRALA